MAGLKKIAFLIPNLQGGGAERVFVTLLRHLDRTRFEPRLVVGRLEGAYVSDLPSDLAPFELGGLRARHVLRTLPQWVHSARPELVFATTGFAAAAALTKPAWPPDTVLVSRLANTLSSFYDDVARVSPGRARMYRWFNRALYLGSNLVICQSDAMLEDTARQVGLGRAKLRRIHNPIDVEHVRTRSIEPTGAFSGAGPHVVSVGNLHWRKGYDVLLRSFAPLQRRWPTATLTILGEGDQRPTLERLVAELGLADRAFLPGFSDNPYPAIRAADLLVSSSRYEGFANVIIESLALGTPVVATDCPGANREVIEHGVGGRLAPADDPRGLTKELDWALENLAELRQSVDAAHTAERFGVRTIVKQYERLFLQPNGSTRPIATAATA